MIISCARCHATPEEIPEYVAMATEEGLTPDDFVIELEGTCDEDSGNFWCTECYLALGMPLGKAFSS